MIRSIGSPNSFGLSSKYLTNNLETISGGIGPLLYSPFVLQPITDADKDKFGDTPWAKEKQWVLIGRYAGARFKLGDDAECRIINDDEVIATIDDPDDIVSV